MKLQDISPDNIFSKKNWLLEETTEGEANPGVRETDQFGPSDKGLFSSLVQFGDKSIHPGLVVKSFLKGGDELDLYVHTKFGWMNIQEQGFMRAAGKYSHEVFPFDYSLASPWKGGNPPTPESNSPHKQAFSDLASQLATAGVSNS